MVINIGICFFITPTWSSCTTNVFLGFGGLDWMQVVACFDGISKKGQIIGLNVVELSPKNDINQISMIVVGRLILKCLMLELSKWLNNDGSFSNYPNI